MNLTFLRTCTGSHVVLTFKRKIRHVKIKISAENQVMFEKFLRTRDVASQYKTYISTKMRPTMTSQLRKFHSDRLKIMLLCAVWANQPANIVIVNQSKIKN